MSNFKIGEKVVCVFSDNEDLIKGEIYTIKKIRPFKGGLQFYEVNCTGDNSGYFAKYRFRKLDYAHTERICAEIIESLKVEEIQYN